MRWHVCMPIQNIKPQLKVWSGGKIKWLNGYVFGNTIYSIWSISKLCQIESNQYSQTNDRQQIILLSRVSFSIILGCACVCVHVSVCVCVCVCVWADIALWSKMAQSQGSVITSSPFIKSPCTASVLLKSPSIPHDTHYPCHHRIHVCRHPHPSAHPPNTHTYTQGCTHLNLNTHTNI